MLQCTDLPGGKWPGMYDWFSIRKASSRLMPPPAFFFPLRWLFALPLADSSSSPSSRSSSLASASFSFSLDALFLPLQSRSFSFFACLTFFFGLGRKKKIKIMPFFFQMNTIFIKKSFLLKIIYLKMILNESQLFGF